MGRISLSSCHKCMYRFVCGQALASLAKMWELWEVRSWKWNLFQHNKECVELVFLTHKEKEGNHNEKQFEIGLICVSVRYVRREHLRLFLSFFLLLSPALEGDSSFSLAWLDILEELCWLKWLGTWRANPPWEAKLALQPPTTHCRRAQKCRTFSIFATLHDTMATFWISY